MSIDLPGSYEIRVVRTDGRTVLTLRGEGPGMRTLDRTLMRGVNILKIKRGAAESVYRVMAPTW